MQVRQTFTTTSLKAFEAMVYAAIKRGVTFDADYSDGTYTITYLGGY